MVAGGFLEVYGETIQILADEVETRQQIDLDQAEQGVQELEAKLGQGIEDPEEYQQSLRRLEMEKARVATAGK